MKTDQKTTVDFDCEYEKFRFNYFPKFIPKYLEIIEENIGIFNSLIVKDFNFGKRFQKNMAKRKKISFVLDTIQIEQLHNQNIISIENLPIANLTQEMKQRILFGKKTDTRISQEIKISEYPSGLYLNYQELKEDKNIPKTPKSFKKRKRTFDDFSLDQKYLKPLIVKNNTNIRFLGKIKFIDPKKKFGFLIKSIDKDEIFFHLSDMDLQGLSMEILKNNKDLIFSFSELEYVGKKAISKKAVEIKLYSN